MGNRTWRRLLSPADSSYISWITYQRIWSTGGMTLTVKNTKYSENLSQGYFKNHKSHMTYSNTETRPLRWAGGEWYLSPPLTSLWKITGNYSLAFRETQWAEHTLLLTQGVAKCWSIEIAAFCPVTLMMDAGNSSKWLATVYQIIRRHITDDSSLNIHRHMKSQTSYDESTLQHFISVHVFNG